MPVTRISLAMGTRQNLHEYNTVDRYVIVGAHFDSWPDGALDPGGATCVLLQLARTFNELYTQTSTSTTNTVCRGFLNSMPLFGFDHTVDWRPRRTLMFAFWDAEEFGLIGSHEFLEVSYVHHY